MKFVKRFTILSFILFLLLSCLSFGNSYGLFDLEDNKDLKLVIAGDLNYPPFEFVSKENPSNYRGLNVDVMRAISIETGVEIELVPMTWADAIKALDSGKVDAIQGMIKTNSRENLYDFSNPYYISEQMIFVQTGNKDINSLEDLKGKKVALQKGDINEEVISQFDDIILKYYPDQESALSALASSEVVATLGNRTTGIYHLQRLGIEKHIKIVGETLSVNEYCVAVQKGNKKTLEIINTGLELIKVKGTLTKINQKWFGEIITDNTKWKTLLILVGFFTMGLLAIVLFIIFVNKRLHRQIENRTRELQTFTHLIEQKDAQKWQILNNISNGIIVFNKNGEVSLFNQMARQLIGEHLSCGQSWWEIKLCQQLGIDIFENAVESHSAYQGTTTYLNSFDNTLHLKYDLTPVSYNDSENELIFLLNDNTQDKIFHDVLHQNDKLSSMGRMSASIAHELRNPLNAIKQYINIMPRKLDQPKFMEQALRILPEELDRLNKIIDGLLDYSKFTDSQKEVLPLKKLIEDTIVLLKVDFLHRRVGFSTNASNEVIFADPKQMKQILINLLINAIEAFPETGGTLEVILHSAGNFVQMDVIDSGTGISKDVLKMVFEPYFTTKKTGYGMGLSITKQLVEENGGTIQINSSPEGTIVSLIFPKYLQ